MLFESQQSASTFAFQKTQFQETQFRVVDIQRSISKASGKEDRMRSQNRSEKSLSD